VTAPSLLSVAICAVCAVAAVCLLRRLAPYAYTRLSRDAPVCQPLLAEPSEVSIRRLGELTWAAPRHVEFLATEGLCQFNPELGRSFTPLAVTHVHEEFTKFTPGIWMYYARGCSTVMWNPGKTIAAHNKIEAALKLLLLSGPKGCRWLPNTTAAEIGASREDGSEVACAKHRLLKYIHRFEHADGSVPLCSRPLCKISNFCDLVRNYPLHEATCPGKGKVVKELSPLRGKKGRSFSRPKFEPWARVAAGLGCPLDNMLLPLLRKYGYDSLQLLASPQGGRLSSWRTELWDVRDPRTTDRILTDASAAIPNAFVGNLSCRGVPCKLIDVGGCMARQGCSHACVRSPLV